MGHGCNPRIRSLNDSSSHGIEQGCGFDGTCCSTLLGTIPSLLTRICSIIGASCYFHLFIAIKIHCFCLDICGTLFFFWLTTRQVSNPTRNAIETQGSWHLRYNFWCNKNLRFNSTIDNMCNQL